MWIISKRFAPSLVLFICTLLLSSCGNTKLYTDDELLNKLQNKYNIEFTIIEKGELTYIEDDKYIRYSIISTELSDLSFEAYTHTEFPLGGLARGRCFSDNVKEIYFLREFEIWAKQHDISYSITKPWINIFDQPYDICINYEINDIDRLSVSLGDFLLRIRNEFPLNVVVDSENFTVVNGTIYFSFIDSNGIKHEIGKKTGDINYINLDRYMMIGDEPNYVRETERFHFHSDISNTNIKIFLEHFAQKYTSSANPNGE